MYQKYVHISTPSRPRGAKHIRHMQGWERARHACRSRGRLPAINRRNYSYSRLRLHAQTYAVRAHARSRTRMGARLHIYYPRVHVIFFRISMIKMLPHT